MDGLMMRWKDDPLEDRFGDVRIVKKFLVFPKKLDDEWRWWETAYIVEKVCKMNVGGSMEWGKYKHYWREIHWLDTKEACFDIYRFKLNPRDAKNKAEVDFVIEEIRRLTKEQWVGK